MQPLHCHLQPENQEMNRTTQTWTTTRCRTQRRNRSRSKRSKPHPPHTRGTFHRRLQPLYTGKHKASCSGFLPKWHSPRSIRAAITMRFAASRDQHASLRPKNQETNRTTQTWTTTRCRNTEEEPITVETIQTAPAAHTRYLSSPAAATLHGKNTRLRAPAFSPNDTPCNMAAESLPSAPAQVPVKLHDLHSNSILYFEYSLTLLLVMWCATHTHHHSLSIVSHFLTVMICYVMFNSHTTIHWV